jgi:hypothetical protein
MTILKRIATASAALYFLFLFAIGIYLLTRDSRTDLGFGVIFSFVLLPYGFTGVVFVALMGWGQGWVQSVSGVLVLLLSLPLLCGGCALIDVSVSLVVPLIIVLGGVAVCGAAVLSLWPATPPTGE